MEIYQLRTFVAVADSGHITRAAEKLHLSQPTVSAHIKALEDAFDLKLFERGPSGVSLTRAGARLREQAEKILSATEDLKRLAASLRGEVAGKLRIGTLSDPNFIRLGEFLSRTVVRYPLLELELRHEITGAALEQIKDGALDASFYFGELPSANVAGIRLREMPYRVVAPAAWAARIRAADWSEIAALPWILTPSISTHNQLVMRLFGEHGVEPAKFVEADQESVITNLVVSGVGVSLVRENLALEGQRAGEMCIWDKGRLVTHLWFIYAAERAADPFIGALVEVLREIWRLDESPTGHPDEPASRTLPSGT